MEKVLEVRDQTGVIILLFQTAHPSAGSSALFEGLRNEAEAMQPVAVD